MSTCCPRALRSGQTAIGQRSPFRNAPITVVMNGLSCYQEADIPLHHCPARAVATSTCHRHAIWGAHGAEVKEAAGPHVNLALCLTAVSTPASSSIFLYL